MGLSLYEEWPRLFVRPSHEKGDPAIRIPTHVPMLKIHAKILQLLNPHISTVISFSLSCFSSPLSLMLPSSSLPCVNAPRRPVPPRVGAHLPLRRLRWPAPLLLPRGATFYCVPALCNYACATAFHHRAPALLRRCSLPPPPRPGRHSYEPPLAVVVVRRARLRCHRLSPPPCNMLICATIDSWVRNRRFNIFDSVFQY